MSVANAVRKAPKRLIASAVGREAALHIFSFISGALVARGALPGSYSPFGASFAAAVPFAYLPAGALGAALSYLLTSPVNAFRGIAVILAIGAIRWLLNEIKKISSSRFFPPAVAFAAVFAAGLALTFSAQSELTTVFECLTEALLSAVGAYFMSRTAALLGSRRLLGGLRQEELACIAMSGCILLLSLAPLTVGAASVGRMLAVLSIMLFARFGGVKGGSVAGIATGVVFSLADTQLLFLSAGYSLSGLIGGLLAPTGKLAVVFSTLLCSVVMSFASPDPDLPLAIALECAAASVIFLLIPRGAGNYLSSVFGSEPRTSSGDAVRRSLTSRLSHCSKALSGVSGCVAAVSEKLTRLYEPGMERVVSSACASACSSCGLRAYCMDKERESTLADMYSLCELFKTCDRITEADVESVFHKRCCKCSELARALNRAYREYLSCEAAERRVTQVRSVVAGQFAGLSDILMELSREFEEADIFDSASAEAVGAALSAMGLTVCDCICRVSSGSGMLVEVELALKKKTAINEAQLVREVSRACGRHFGPPCLSFAGDFARAALSELPLYRLEIGSAQHICDDGSLCGDCINYFDNGEGSSVALISDGMGSGGRAAVDANMAVSIMTRLCKAGLGYDCSLSVVNSSLMIKSEEETLATLDLADFNLFTGRLRLMKAGACVTYIRRGSRLLIKDMPSLPLGILNEAKFAKDDIALSADDMIVMISDGALIGSPEWLEKLILRSSQLSSGELASAIVEEARRRRQDSRDDDITAIAMRVAENA